MKINNSQVNLLIQLQQEIQEKLGVVLGYTQRMGSFVPEDSDFIVYCDDDDDNENHLLHPLDFTNEPVGEFHCVQSKAEHLVHDDKCVEFMTGILRLLESGGLLIHNKRRYENPAELVDAVEIQQLGENTFGIDVFHPTYMNGFNYHSSKDVEYPWLAQLIEQYKQEEAEE